MKSRSVKNPVWWRVLVMLHGLLGTAAIFGGITLMLDPSGESVNMPATLLETSPFNSFLIPGILLFLFLGVLPLVTAYGLFTERPWKLANKVDIYKNMHWAWNWSLYTGFAVIIWITVQVFMIQELSILQLVFITLGLAIQAVTLLPSVQDIFRVEKEEVQAPFQPKSS